MVLKRRVLATIRTPIQGTVHRRSTIIAHSVAFMAPADVPVFRFNATRAIIGRPQVPLLFGSLHNSGPLTSLTRTLCYLLPSYARIVSASIGASCWASSRGFPAACGCREPSSLRYSPGSSTVAKLSSSSSSSSHPSGISGGTNGLVQRGTRVAGNEAISSASSGSNTSGINTETSSTLSQPAALDSGQGGSNATSSWGLVFAAVWPASPVLRARVVAAVGSLLVAKCLTIAAPVALAGLVDHFTQITATGVASGAGGAVGATGPAALLHPALPVGLVISYPLARLGASAFSELRTALFARVSQRASRELAATAFSHMHATAFSSNNKIGELTAMLTRGTKAISQLLNVLLFQVVPTTLEFLMVLALLQLRVGWTVAATAVVTLSAYWAFTAAVTTRRAKLRREMNRLESQSSGLLVDSLANAEAVRYFTAEEFEAHRFGALQHRLEEQIAKVNESLAFLNFGQQMIFTSGLAAALLYTASLVAAGIVPVGQLVLVSTLLMQLAVPLNFIGTAYREVTLNAIDLEKLQQLLQLQPLVQDPLNPVTFQLRGGAVEFRDVTFSYPPAQSLDQATVQQKQRQHHGEDGAATAAAANAGRLVLKGFSLEVPAGRHVALVGESGSGKTTLIRLLYRLIDPTRGSVCIDGQDLKTLSMMSFRRHIGIVPQEVALFNESLGFNLRYGSPNVTDEQVKEAIRLAELTDLVEALPAGLDTPVGDRGLRLSGGEKQRVGIARCLLRNPQIVLFDEATSALDLHTEHKILKALSAVSRGRTTLVIAHRLSTVAGADFIAVLDGGRVAEIGTHTELLQKPNGLYASMWERQREGQTGETLQRL